MNEMDAKKFFLNQRVISSGFETLFSQVPIKPFFRKFIFTTAFTTLKYCCNIQHINVDDHRPIRMS